MCMSAYVVGCCECVVNDHTALNHNSLCAVSSMIPSAASVHALVIVHLYRELGKCLVISLSNNSIHIIIVIVIL